MLSFWLLVLVGCGRSPTVQQEGPTPLDSGASSVWWNAAEQKLATPPVSALPNADDFLSDRATLPDDPKPTETSNSNRWDWNWNWLRNLDLSTFVKLLGVALIIAAIVILIHVIRKPAIQIIRSRTAGQDRLLRESVKVVDLPFDVDVAEDGFLPSAKRFAESGNFNAAVIYLFSFILVELDHHQFLLLRRGKTNRMYLRDLRVRPDLADCFRKVMLVFERAFFGQHTLTKADYENCLAATNLIAKKTNQNNPPKAPEASLATDTAIRSLLCIAALLALAGCEKLPSETYGSAQSPNGDSSLSGFTVLRSMFESTGRKSTTVSGLTPRLDRFGAIVWTPDCYTVPTADQCAWIDDWLTRNPNSTFIYVGRDYSAGSDYWTTIANTAEPNRRLPYLQQASQSLSKSDEEFIAQSPRKEQYSKWFIFGPQQGSQRRVTATLAKSWTESLDTVECSIRCQLMPITAFSTTELMQKFAKDIRDHLIADIEVQADRLYEQRLNPWEYDEEYESPDVIYDSSYYENMATEPEEEPMAAEALEPPAPSIEELAERRYEELVEDADSNGNSSSQDLLRDDTEALDQVATARLSSIKTSPWIVGDDGAPLAFEVTDDRWLDSKLIVLSNSSLCCNYALADQGRRQTTMAMIEETREQGRVAFISNPQPRLQYSSPPSNDPFGLALFLVYPLNVILAHGLLLGIAVMIALWPIFGRAQQIVEKGASDFGKHVDAFGQLLMRTKDRSFALHNIARYHREVKKDPKSKWATLDQANPVMPIVPGSEIPRTSAKPTQPTEDLSK